MHAQLQLCIVSLHKICSYAHHQRHCKLWFGATIQSCSGACVWLIIILVIVSCTDLSLYFLDLFSNFIQVVSVVLTHVQLNWYLFNFLKIFICLVSFLFYCPLDYFLSSIVYNAICYTHCMMVLWNYSNLLYSSPGPGSTRDQSVAITKATTDWTMQDLRLDLTLNEGPH